jgi:AcrR family transcriptional regulator
VTPRPPQYTARGERRARTHEHIIEVAADLLYRNGIQQVSMDDIATECGVTKATVYQHFATKDQLISDCLAGVDRAHFDWFVEQTARRARGPASALQAVFLVLDQWFNSSVFRGCAFINATIQLPDQQHPAHLAVLNHKQRTRDWLRSLALAEGFDQTTALRLSSYLMILMEGAIVTALVQGDLSAARQAGEAASMIIERYRELPSGTPTRQPSAPGMRW